MQTLLHSYKIRKGALPASLGILLIMGLISCQSGSSGENARFDMATEAEEQSQAGENQELDIERKLIKEGYAVFETENLDTTRKVIFAAVEKHDAYVSADQAYTSPGRNSNTITIRVPAENFDKLLSEATVGIGKFDSKNVEIKDVTEEFVDVQARLKTKKELETRYLVLLQDAKSVIEILEVEKQIGQLRADIESIEGRLKYLQNKIALATLTLTFYEQVPNETNFVGKFKNGFKNGWDNLIWFFVYLTNIWPFLVILLVLGIGWRRWRKKG